MSQIEERKQIDEMLENTNFDYTYSPMGEQQGLLEEMFEMLFVSSKIRMSLSLCILFILETDLAST